MKYKELVPKPTGYEKTISRTAEPRNTVKSMQRIARENAWQVEGLAKALEREDGDPLENLWDWVRENIRYVNDPAKAETLRTPSRTVHDGKGDCDCMSILIMAVLLNWRTPHLIRVVDVKGKGWEHVYIVALDKGKEICLDTVPEITHFGNEHFYREKFDTYMYTTELGGLGAIGAEELQAVKVELRNTLADMTAVQFADPEQEALRQKEAAILKIVLDALDKGQEQRRFVLTNAVQQSVLLQDVYIEMLRTDQSEGLSGAHEQEGMAGLFDKIKDGLDKLGETALGKAFRTARDKIVPMVDPLGISKAGGNIFNQIAAKDKATVNNSEKNQPMSIPQGLLPSTQRAGDNAPSNSAARDTPPSDTPPSDTPEKWYKTTKGMIGLGLGAAAIIALIVWMVKSSQANSKRLAGIRRRRRKPTAAAAKRRKSTRKALAGISMKRRSTASTPVKSRKKRKATATTKRKTTATRKRKK